MDTLARCGHCGHSFAVAAKFTGGLVPCANCGKVVEVPGLRDPMWLALRLGMLLIAVAIGVIVGRSAGARVGAMTTAGALFAFWLLSRAL